MNLSLVITIPDDFDAEDSLWNDFQDVGILDDLIAVPVRHSLWEYLASNYGKRLWAEVEVKILISDGGGL